MSKESKLVKSTPLKITQLSAWIIILIGVMSLIGWLLDLTFLKSFSDKLVAIKPNASIEFILAGIFIIIWTSQKSGPSKKRFSKPTMSIILLVFWIIAILTMFEYLTEINFGIDQLLFNDKSILSVHPGRMAPNALILFLLSGAALILISSEVNLKNKGLISGILGLVVASSGSFSFAVYPWFSSQNIIGNFNPMAISAAVGFVILGAGIFSLSIELEKNRWSLKRNITLGFVGGMLIGIGINVISEVSIINQQDSSRMVSHTQEVEYHLGQISYLLLDLEIKKQAYLQIGNREYQKQITNIWGKIYSELNEFKKLTVDNTSQQLRSAQLEKLLKERAELLNRTFADYESKGIDVLSDIRIIKERTDLINEISKILNNADSEEKKLLAVREENLNATSKRTFFLVPLGSFASTGILVWIFMLLNSEVSERKQSEFALKKSESHLNRINRLYVVLSQISHTIVEINDKLKLFDEACRILVEYGNFRMAWIGEINEQTNLVRPVTYYGVNEGYLDNIIISINDPKFQSGPTGLAIKTHKYNICNDIENDPRMVPWKEKALKLNFRSSAAFPLLQSGKPVFPLTVYSSESHFFDEDEINMMNAICMEISFALRSLEKEKEKREMEEEVLLASLYNRSLIEASLDPLVTISPEGKITDANSAVEKVTGTPKEKIIGTDFSDYFTEPDQANEGYKMVFYNGIVKDYPLTIRHISGKQTDVLYNATTYKNQKGEIQGVFAAARDITELKRKEEELSRLNDDLNRSNQELEQFAYVASHDLQEPLRMVASFTQLLEKRYKDNLDEDAIEFIHYAVDGATRMQRLINDLLDYSRVTTRGKPLVKVDLSAALGLALANLQTRIQESAAVIVYDNLPVVKGDETQLMRVFQNLIDNAIKFRRNETPKINITSVVENNKAVISIQDNGIGIDLKYKERIFIIFQRLHNVADYPGTGIGLAVCKRTIERHGGKLWFESQPGKGTTFKFSLNL